MIIQLLTNPELFHVMDAVPMNLSWWKGAQSHWKTAGHSCYQIFFRKGNSVIRPIWGHEYGKAGKDTQTFIKTEMTQRRCQILQQDFPPTEQLKEEQSIFPSWICLYPAPLNVFLASPNPSWCFGKCFGHVNTWKGRASFREGSLPAPQCFVFKITTTPLHVGTRRGSMLAFGPWKASMCLLRRGLCLPNLWHLCDTFLRRWFEMGRIKAARSWLLTKTEGWDIWEIYVDAEPFPELEKQNWRVQVASMGIEKKKQTNPNQNRGMPLT